MATEHDEQPAPHGQPALAGFDYQIEVSVWLALDLLLATQLTNELVLEPLSQEDLEANLDELEPPRTATTGTIKKYQLVVQAKLRNGDAWTVANIKSLLEHGKRRQPAAQRLVDPSVRYLLVTSAAVNGAASKFSVKRVGSWPEPDDVPASLLQAVPNIKGRFAVMERLDEERLSFRIKSLLVDSFRVPNARWEQCLSSLRNEAKLRMRGAGGGRWTRLELKRVITDHEGYFASSAELQDYVHPTNWTELVERMETRHALLIAGPSGTGKTLATRKLYEELSASNHGLARVRINPQFGPQQLNADQTAPPVLYDIEDPWGRIDFEPERRSWNDQLANFFATATHDRKIVATSRLDVLQSAGPDVLKSLQPWIVQLNASNYGRRQLNQLYRTRIPRLPRRWHLLARDSERSVLEKLKTPLEIQKFFDAIQTGGLVYRNDAELIAEAIERAHQDSIVRTVVDQIQQRNDVSAAAVIWALLRVSDRFSWSELHAIEEALSDVEPNLPEGASPLARFFVAAHHLRQNVSSLSYYHPRVEEGIETALKSHRLTSRRTLGRLVEVMVTLGERTEPSYLLAAVRVLQAAADRLPDTIPRLSPETQERIDRWLERQLSHSTDDLATTLRLAATAGSDKSNVSEAARFLLHRRGSTFEEMMTWVAPEREDLWYERLRADQNVRQLLDSFIRHVLPTERERFREGFIEAIDRLAPNLTDSFLAAAAEVVHFGVTPTAGVIAEGALRDPDKFETVVDSAVSVLTLNDEERRDEDVRRLAVVNGEYDEAYVEYLASDDHGHSAHVFLEAYVERVRGERTWSRLTQHRHAERLRSYWLRTVSRDSKPDPEEILHTFHAAYGSEDEASEWHVLERFWDARYLSYLQRRVREGHLDEETRVTALACLVVRAPTELGPIANELLDKSERGRLADIAIELARVQKDLATDDETARAASSAAVVPALPGLYAEITAAAHALINKRVPTLRSEARALLESVTGVSPQLRHFRVQLDQHVSMDVQEDVRWLLANASESDVAVDAIDAAIRHRMDADVEAALAHRFSHVVARALEFVGVSLPTPLPSRLLDLAHAKAGPVRTALVNLLRKKPHADHLPTLLHLSHDQWSRGGGYYGEPEDYPIAQAALFAIAELGTLSDAAVDELFKLAGDTEDVSLRLQIFFVVCRHAKPGAQAAVLKLALDASFASHIRRSAAWALRLSVDALAPRVVARITPDLPLQGMEAVGVSLAVVIATKGDVEAVKSTAQKLAASADRRVFLLPMIKAAAERDPALAEYITTLLPPHHPAIAWALHRNIEIAPNLLDDLGDAVSVAEVLRLMTK